MKLDKSLKIQVTFFFFFTLIFIIVWAAVTAQIPYTDPFTTQAFMDIEGEITSLEQVVPPNEALLDELVLAPWFRWDTIWYLHIAQFGYGEAIKSLAYPPLYPLVIRLVGGVFGGHYLLAALLVSWVSFFLALRLLARQYLSQVDRQTAFRALRNLLIFPTTFFFFAGYTESLFLLLLLLAWQNGERRQWWQAAFWGSLAVLCRYHGVFITLPLAWLWLKDHVWQPRQEGKKFLLPSFSTLKGGVHLACIPLVYFGWGLYTKIRFGYTPSENLNVVWRFETNWPWVGIWGSIKEIFVDPSFVSTSVSALNLAALALFCLALYWSIKQKRYEESLFMSAVIITSLIKLDAHNFLVSTSRYMIILFPAYLALAEVIKNQWLDRLWFILSLSGWLVASALFFAWFWIA